MKMKIALTRTLPLLLSATASKISATPCPTLIGLSSCIAFLNSPPVALSSSSFSYSKTTNHHHNIHMNIKMMSSSPSSWSPQQKKTLLACPTIPLRDGTPHPAIGFGTYKVGFIPASASSAASTVANAGNSKNNNNNEPQRTAEECIRDALDLGYRFLECAEFYGNEAQVGKAIQESGVPREELFLCSKVWTSTIEKGDDAIRTQLDKTLADLDTTYLDLYLIHWPVPGKHVDAYKTLEQLQAEGKVRNIGISNYVVEDYRELLENGISSKPVVNQIEINPFLYRKNTIEYFQREGVVLQSYRSLRDGKAMDHPTLLKIGAAHSKSPAQILGRWCVEHGFVYVPKSVKLVRMAENAQVFDFKLSDEEMMELDNLTTPEALSAFEALYKKCVNRDTSKDGTMEGVKMNITVD